MLFNKFLIIALLVITGSCGICDDNKGHIAEGTKYEKGSIKAYALKKHGPDGVIFLDPFFIPYITDLKGQTILDAGCGAAPWSIVAAENGARVFGIDLQKNMIDIGLAAVKAVRLSHQITLEVGDVAALPYTPSFFDRAISVNVGCNLPSTTVLEGGKKVGLGPHMYEIARVLKNQGMAVITAPASFGVVFTDGTSKDKVMEHIKKVLEEIKDSEDPSMIVSRLNELKEVYRATFARREGKLILITDEKELKAGEEIWRKLPGLTVPNRYHSESDYLQAFQDAELKLVQIYRPHFSDKKEREGYNAKHLPEERLGEEYEHQHPFIIFCITKS
jgi:SAM-dependent methyltransferase